MLTFHNCQKCNQSHTIMMCLLDIIMNEAIWHIEWIILVVTHGNGDGHLITSQYDRTQCCPMVWHVFCNFILLSIQHLVTVVKPKGDTTFCHEKHPDMKSWNQWWPVFASWTSLGQNPFCSQNQGLKADFSIHHKDPYTTHHMMLFSKGKLPYHQDPQCTKLEMISATAHHWPMWHQQCHKDLPY